MRTAICRIPLPKSCSACPLLDELEKCCRALNFSSFTIDESGLHAPYLKVKKGFFDLDYKNCRASFCPLITEDMPEFGLIDAGTTSGKQYDE